jgi:hypothetical protein
MLILSLAFFALSIALAASGVWLMIHPRNSE